MAAEEQTCCGCCCRLIFTSGLTALFLWLSLRVNSPTCSIENFTVFALNKTANSSIKPNNSTNHTIRYDLKLNNKDNKDKGIYYDTLNLTFYYKLNQTSVSIGNATFKDFYQGHGKKTHRIATIDGGKGVKWENDTATTASFRVVLNTSVRYKILFWKTKRRRLDLSAALLVDETGSLIKRKKKGIKFTSKGWNSRGCNFLVLGILGFLSFILFW